MRRFFLLWLLIVTSSALIAAAVQGGVERSRASREADARASTLLTTIEEPVVNAFHAKRFSQIAKIVQRLKARNADSVTGLAICSNTAKEAPRAFPIGSGWQSLCANAHVRAVLANRLESGWEVSSSALRLRFLARAVEDPRSKIVRVLVLVQNAAFLGTPWIRDFARNFFLYWLGGIALLALVATQIRRWLQQNLLVFRRTLRSLLAGKSPRPISLPTQAVGSDLTPLNRDIDELAKKIRFLSDSQAKKAKDSSWLGELRRLLSQRELIVVANREPYIHQRKSDGSVHLMRPASGLVTALEPVLRQSGGLWIAHGSGSADRETSDADGMVDVPPSQPRYQLKRVWLTREEENGYYYGFANEGLWPLCHLAHTRPSFRLNDWEYYQTVNRKFCDSIPTEKLRSQSVFLIQDYHFALLPQMLRQASRPLDGGTPKIGLFWHIPWPNPEAFGICPWNQQLLRGMLGSDVVGFHTQYHCNNFLETCNRYLEARIDYERFSVTMENHETLVRAFPIGIDTSPVIPLSGAQVHELKRKYGITAEKVAVGVDRIDYTKGLVERIDAVERFLEKNPEWIGRFSLVQMGSPSRTQIPAYQDLARNIDAAVTRVNNRFTSPTEPDYRPVIMLSSHHDWEEIQYFYQMGDMCLVTSLHDGMNLVAKEYVWCQTAERGSLVLSKFAGASRELTEAFIINPYSTEETADAIALALKLTPLERELRMRMMKDKVQSRSAFHWASDLIQAVIEKEETVPSLEDLDLSNRSTLAKVF